MVESEVTLSTQHEASSMPVKHQQKHYQRHEASSVYQDASNPSPEGAVSLLKPETPRNKHNCDVAMSHSCQQGGRAKRSDVNNCCSANTCQHSLSFSLYCQDVKTQVPDAVNFISDC